MKGERHSGQQIVLALWQAATGTSAADICRKMGSWKCPNTSPSAMRSNGSPGSRRLAHLHEPAYL